MDTIKVKASIVLRLGVALSSFVNPLAPSVSVQLLSTVAWNAP